MKETFGAIAVGLLLLVIGSSTGTEWVLQVGTLVLPLSFVWAGLFKSEENLAIRITLLAIGGFLMAQSFGGSASFLQQFLR